MHGPLRQPGRTTGPWLLRERPTSLTLEDFQGKTMPPSPKILETWMGFLQALIPGSVFLDQERVCGRWWGVQRGWGHEVLATV